MSPQRFGRPPQKPRPPKPAKRARNAPWNLETTTTFDNDIAHMSTADQTLYMNTLREFARNIDSCYHSFVEGARIWELDVGRDKRITFDFDSDRRTIIAYRAGPHARVLPAGARRDRALKE